MPATTAGGIGAIHQLVKKLGLDVAIDKSIGLLKIHLPYLDTDHVLKIADNLLAGGTCLEHLELLRSNAAYLDASERGGFPTRPPQATSAAASTRPTSVVCNTCLMAHA